MRWKLETDERVGERRVLGLRVLGGVGVTAITASSSMMKRISSMSGGSKDSRSGAHALPSTSLPCRPVACDGVASSSNLAGRSALSAGRFAAQGAQKAREGVDSDVHTDGTEH